MIIRMSEFGCFRKLLSFYVIGFICLEFAAEFLSKVQELRIENEVRTSVFSF